MSLDQDTVSAAADTNSGVSIPGERAPTAQPQIGGEDDTETRARAMGWVGKDEFRGPADKWRPADEFVKKGEEDLPILRERLRDSTRKTAELEQRLARQNADFEANFKRLEGMSAVALQRQREQLLGSYAAAQRDAVQNGDVLRYDQLERDKFKALDDYDQRIAQVAQPVQQPRGAPALPPHEASAVSAWRQQNAWFDSDPEMNMVAQARHMQLQMEKPGLTLEENLRLTSDYVRQRYADKFGSAPRMGAPAVEGGSRIASGGGSLKRSAQELPAEARAQGEKFVKQGLFKNINEYASEYWSQE